MPEASLKDRLQPALLDRLSDDERFVTVFRVTPDVAALAEQGLVPRDIHRALIAQGLRPMGALEGGAPADDATGPLEYFAPGRSVSPAHLRGQMLRGPRSPTAVGLGSCCRVEATSVMNDRIESPDRRAISMRRLREAVLRDLGWLFNSFNLEETQDLSAYPEVKRSVLNYGLPSQAGRAVSSIDAAEMARRLAEVVTHFEPRLSGIRVTPERDEATDLGMTLAFRVEAELWGQPVAQHLSLRTSIDFMSGDVEVADEAARG
jgi:type VI secretion system protein ImpF